MISSFAFALCLPLQVALLHVETNEVRAYDLSPLRVPVVDAPEEKWTFVPQGLVHILDVDDEYNGSDAEVTEMFFPGLVADLLGEELSFEGRAMQVLDDGTLMLVGPESLHSQVERIHGFLREVASERIELAVDVIEGPDLGDPSLKDWGRRLDAIAPERRTRHLISLAAADWASVRSTVVAPIVLDFNVEIAQGAGVGDPIVMGVESGLRMDLQAVPAKGGVVLTTIVRQGELLSLSSVDLGLGLRLSGEDRQVSTVMDANKMQTYQLRGHGAAGSAFLPSGGALVQQANVRGAVRTIVIRHVGGELLPRREMALSSAGDSLVLLNEHAHAPSQINPWGNGLIASLVRPYYNQGPGKFLLGVSLFDGNGPELLDLMGAERARQSALVARYGPWRVFAPRGENFSQTLAAIQEKLDTGSQVGKSLRITGELVVDGEVHATFSVPTLESQRAVFGLGIEGLDVVDYDVEVAQFSSIVDPSVVTRFDGLMGSMRAKMSTDGRLDLELRAAGNWSLAEQRVELGTPLMGGFDMAAQGRLFVDERRVLLGDGSGEWTTTFGAQGQRGASLRIGVVQE